MSNLYKASKGFLGGENGKVENVDKNEALESDKLGFTLCPVT